MSGQGTDQGTAQDARDLATAIDDAIGQVAAARDALERARAIAARRHWATPAVACGTASRRLDALSRKLQKEGGTP